SDDGLTKRFQGLPSMHYDSPAPARPAPARSSLRWVFLILAVVILVAGWTAVWFYAAERANAAIAGWIEREARAGRVYTCGSQSLRGYPFRIEVRCTDAALQMHALQPPVSVRMGDVLFAAQIYQPTLLIGEWSAPLTIADEG